MTMRTPAMAMLWECWRLSRNRQLTLMLVAILAGAALLVGSDGSDFVTTHVMFLVAFLTFFGYTWLREDRRNRFAPYLGFTRPIPTWVLVTVPMGYVCVSTAVEYLIPTILLSAAFGIAFPLLPLAAALSTISVANVATGWCTGSKTLRGVLAVLVLLAYLPWYFTTGNALSPDRWSETFGFSTAHYGVMGLIAAGSMALTILGASLQRRGDDLADYFRRPVVGAGALSRSTALSRLSDAVPVQCPVSSPTRAQIWFETRTSGLRVLTSGAFTAVAMALTGRLLPAIGASDNIAILAFWGLLIPLIVGSRSMLGVRRKEGIAYLSAFDATRPMGTARLIALKVGATSLAILVSWLAIGAAIWVSVAGRPGAKAVVADYLGSPSVARFAIMVVLVTAAMAYAASVHAFLLLNARRAVAIGLGGGVYLVALVYATATGWVGETAFSVQVAIVAGAGLLTALYLFREVLRERVVTSHYSVVLVAAGASFSLASLFLVNPPTAIGGKMDYDEVALLVLFVPGLMAAVLAPWSFSRIRHR